MRSPPDAEAVRAESLMLRVAAGDALAFQSLYDSHHRLVFGIAIRMLGDARSAEDLTQTVYLKVWANPAAFVGGSFAAWISRVTRNGALDVLRQSIRGNTRFPVDEQLADLPEDVVISGIEAQRARDAVARLSQDERSLIEMGYFGGMTYRRIAEVTGIPLGTVKTRIRSGLHRLRSALAYDATAGKIAIQRAAEHRSYCVEKTRQTTANPAFEQVR